MTQHRTTATETTPSMAQENRECSLTEHNAELFVALGFAAGVGIGAVATHLLLQPSRPDPMLEQLGRRVMSGLQAAVPEQLMSMMPKR